MKFVDQVRITVKAGDGGNGAVAFRREKYVEKGGPSGGDGGDGGSVIFVADRNLTTLLDYRYQRLHKAKNGEHGMGNDMNGRAAPDLVLRVPVGTLIRDEQTGETIADLDHDGQQVVVAQGGRGGLGNMNFATSTRQAPRFAQDGTPGQQRDLVLELKLLADVGLLGFPNAGKSTLIAKVSRARPKVADYPFTTLVPNLGLVPYRDERSFVMADVPGIIEGAAEGAGLGHRFLRHVERCKVLVHVIDMVAAGEDRDPLRDFDVLNRELEKYSPELARKKQIVAANKMDVTEAQEKFPILVEFMKERGITVYPISALTGEGVQALLDAVARELFGAPERRGKSRAVEASAAGGGDSAAVVGRRSSVVGDAAGSADDTDQASAPAAPATPRASTEKAQRSTVKKSANTQAADKPAPAKSGTTARKPATRKKASPARASAVSRAAPATSGTKADKPATTKKAAAAKGFAARRAATAKTGTTVNKAATTKKAATAKSGATVSKAGATKKAA
ncbi:MAG: GTPase ObgE, partial [Myxococcaceae bacterium]|nr:GTPase ObgE [Myxococcaceae bacterium]